MSLTLQNPSYGMASGPDGALRIEIAGRPADLRPSGALWLEADRALVVADLHLEKGSAFAARGQMLPPYDTSDTLGRLEREIGRLSPETVVLLGDTFHDSRAERRLTSRDTDTLMAMGQRRTLIWVVGNHDTDGPRTLPGKVVDEISLGGLNLRHEPRTGVSSGEVAGHLHPCAKVAMRGRAVRRRCFVTDGERVVVPAFGAYAGGLNVLDVAFSSLFVRPPLIGALGQQRTHPIAWRTALGD